MKENTQGHFNSFFARILGIKFGETLKMQLPENPITMATQGLSHKVFAEETKPLQGIQREATSEEGEMCHGRDFSQAGIIVFFSWMLPFYHLFLLEQILK